MPTHEFEDLEVWKSSRILVREIRSICKDTNASRDFNFVDQITSAARSVSANIAEGSESTSNQEFMQFLNYAKRSCGEVRSHLYDAIEERYITPEKFRSLKNLTRSLGRQLGAFHRYLSEHRSSSSPVTRNS